VGKQDAKEEPEINIQKKTNYSIEASQEGLVNTE